MGVLDFVQNTFGSFFSWLTGIENDTDREIDVNRRGGVQPIPVVIGRRYIENGIVVFEDTGGSDDKYLYMCVVLCVGEVEEIEEVFIDGKPFSDFGQRKMYDGATGTWSGDDNVVIQKFTGTTSQAQSTLLNSSSKWSASSNRQGKGVCYLACRFKGRAKFFTGKPQVGAVVRGLKLYDPRDASTSYSANGALAVYNFLTNSRWGRGLSTSLLGTSFNDAANDVDNDSEDYQTEVNLGTPDETETDGTRTYLRWWDTKPAGASALPGLSLRNTGSTKTGISGVTFQSQGWFGNRYRLSVAIQEMLVGSVFTTSDTIYAAGTSRSRLECNVMLNGGTERQTYMKNLQKLLPSCRGLLPRFDKYELYVEKDIAPVYEITEADVWRSSGFEIDLEDKKKKVNRVTARFRNPEKMWQEDIVIYPEPGSTEDTNLLAADNGVRLEKEVTFDHVIDKYTATDLAKVALYKFRNDLRVRLECRPALLNRRPGEVVQLTLTSPGWNQKEFLITSTGITRTGRCVLELVEFEDSIYSYDTIPNQTLSDNTDLPDPFYAAPPTSLTYESVYDQLDSGVSVYFLKIGWTEPADADVEGYEVQIRKDGQTKWRQAQFTQDDEVYFTPVKVGQLYDVRVRTRIPNDIHSDWLTGSYTVVADSTAPANPTVNSVTGIILGLDVEVTAPSDLDVTVLQIFYDETAIPGSPQFTLPCNPGEKIRFQIPGLAAETTYKVWARAVDYAGNVSGNNASVSDTTLADPNAAAGAAQETADAIVQAGGNIILDPHFDLADGATVTNAYWQTSGAGISINSTGGEDGGPCLQFDTAAATYRVCDHSDVFGADLLFRCREGDRFAGEARIFVPTSYDDNLSCQVKFLEDDGTTVAGYGKLWDKGAATENAWSTVSTKDETTPYVVAPAGARYFVVQIFTGNIGAGGFTAYVDNVRVWNVAGKLGSQDSVAGGGSGDIDADAIGTNELDGSASGAFNQEIIMSTSGELHTVDKDDFGDVTAGIWIGYSGGAYKFDIGDATDFIQWNGTDLSISNLRIVAGGGGFGQSLGIGLNALDSETSYGRSNIAIGEDALTAVTSGSDNIAIGIDAGDALTTGFDNVLIGSGAGGTLNTGYDNVIIGDGAGANLNTDDRNNILLGAGAMSGCTGQLTTVIGGTWLTTGDKNDQLYIGQAGITDDAPIILGDHSSRDLSLHADVIVSDDDGSSTGTLTVEGDTLYLGGDQNAANTQRLLQFGSASAWQVFDSTQYDNAIVANPNGKVTFYYAGSALFETNFASLTPTTDDAYDLGASGSRWDDVYATNATIQTSDARDKDIYGLIDPATAWAMNERIDWISYKWSDYDRLEEWEEIEVPVTEWIDEPVEEIREVDGKHVLVKTTRRVERRVYDEVPLFDENGDPVMVEQLTGEFEQIPVFDRIPITETIPHPDKVDLDEEGNEVPRMVTILTGEYEEVPRLDENGGQVYRNGKPLTHLVQRTKSIKRMHKIRRKIQDAERREFNRIHFGLTAQQFSEVCDSVGLDARDLAPYIEDSNGKLGFRYGEYIAILATVVQELQRRITQLETEKVKK